MISNTHRFHGHNSLRYVYQRGEVVRGQHMATKSILNDRQKNYRLAVVVSKKVSKSAVKRNRIRRRIYEQVRLLESQITRPYDIVITVYGEQLAELPIQDLTNQIHHQLKQSGILTAHPTPVHDKIEPEGE